MLKNQRPKKDSTKPQLPSGATEGEDQLLPPSTDHNPGRGLYRRQLEKFAKLDDKAKHEELKAAWKEVAMGAAQRAKQFVATCAPKDFGRLYQVIMSGAVSIDKAYPPKEKEHGPAFVVNLFGSLGSRAGAIATPQVPHVVEATEVRECQSLPLNTESSSPTATVNTIDEPLSKPLSPGLENSLTSP